MKIEIDIDQGEPIKLDEFPTDGIAEALAAELREAVERQPGAKWNRTGHLMRSIAASDDAVSVASDRLQRDDLAEKFADEVMPADPLNDRRVQEATEKAVAEAIKPTARR